MELYVFNNALTPLAEISDYDSLVVEKKYGDVSKLVLRLEYTTNNSSRFAKGNFISLQTDPTYVYYIDHFSVVTENSMHIIEVFAYSANYFTKWRVFTSQQTYSGSASSLIRYYVDRNMISSPNNRRNVPNLFLRDRILNMPTTEFSVNGDNMGEYLFNVARQYNITFDIRITIADKKFHLDVWQGVNRTVEQPDVPPVVFSIDMDNVLDFEYYDDDGNMRNVAYVAGEEKENASRVIQIANGTLYSGLQRREIYVDANDIKQRYEDDITHTEVVLTNEEYDTILIERGLEQLLEFNTIKSYETTVDDVQYKIGVDYDLGDIVTIYDRTLGIYSNVTVSQVTITSSGGVTTVNPSFGTGIPKSISSMRRRRYK